MRFSFLGVGNMGAPLAFNLLKAGETLTIFSRRKDCAAQFARVGAIVANDIAELGQCDVLCTCLPMPQHVLDAATGDNGLYAKMPRGAVHLEFSTLDPGTAQKLADAAAKHGISYVQATVSKTPEIAAKGDAPLFVGGDAVAMKKLWPILEKIAKPRDLKTIEASCAVKLISNLIGMSNVALVAEGLRIGKLAGIDSRELLDLLLETGCASFQMKTRGPWMADDDYKARFSCDIAAKDLRLGCAMAKKWGFKPKLMPETLSYLEEAHAKGIGDEDVCAIYKLTQ